MDGISHGIFHPINTVVWDWYGIWGGVGYHTNQLVWDCALTMSQSIPITISPLPKKA